MKLHALTLALLVATPATANIEAIFSEGAPKDRFTFTNTGGCALGPTTLTLNLADTPAGLIFDTSPGGAGVEVFQPYEIVQGGELVTTAPTVTDGATQITLDLTGLGAGQSVAFTIDVDDTLAQSSLGQIRVSDSEIAGASVVFSQKDGSHQGVFDTTSRAVISLAGCLS